MENKPASIAASQTIDAKGSLVKSFDKQILPGGKYYKKWQAGKELGNGLFFIYFKTNYGTAVNFGTDLIRVIINKYYIQIATQLTTK